MFTSLTSLFFPAVCAACSQVLLSHELCVCTACRHELPRSGHLTDLNNEAMIKCYGRIPVVFACAFFQYHKNGLLQQLIHNLKYRGMEDVGRAMGQWCGAELVALGVFADADLVLPVPLHKSKLRKRGYNQVDLLARTLADTLHKEFNNTLLIRTQKSKTQTRKNLFGRTDAGAQELFAVTDTLRMAGRHILIVDDVMTTGSTLEACSRALLKIPNVKISIFCLGMSQS